MMRIIALTLTTFGFVAAATAQTMVEDSDGDGMYSIDELRVAFPELTDETFVTIDTDADGMVSTDELAAAEEAGLVAAG